ncbi:MAG: rane-associated protein [Acidimicrobiaceae bacterium]|jgi:membrane protein DedA with SNARE-associated domain
MLQTLLDAVPSDVGLWIYFVVFAAAASESALFLGLVVPGETVLLVAGVLASRGQGHVVPYMVAAITGAVAGDSIGYELGRHFGPRLRRSALGRRVGEERWDRAEHYLQTRGGRAIFFGRWIAVARAIVPALAGQAHMPYGHFLLWNVAGAIPVGVLHVGLGYLAGQSYTTVERYLSLGHWALLGIVVVVGAIVYWRHRRSARSE